MISNRMWYKKTAILVIILSFIMQGCASEKLNNDESLSKGAQTVQEYTAEPVQAAQTGGAIPEGDSDGDTVEESGNGDSDSMEDTEQVIDLDVVKPNECGRIMVVMFHNFVEEYTKGDKLYTTTFDAFGQLLETLYTSGYRLVNLNDYLSGNIDIPAGNIPMVFTFDDGTAGQFNLIEENGILKANPRSAVGILEEFNKKHPDFGLKGTFYVNLGNSTFAGAGTIAQRLEYLTEKGFEIGNHTYTHINLKQAKTADKIQEEIGGNQKKLLELLPGYIFKTFSLPYGAPSKELKQYVIKGEYEGVSYENIALMEVGWDPASSPFSVKFDPLSTHRVRSSGIEPVEADLAWWLENMSRDKQYVSDGNVNKVTVPESYREYVNQSALNGRELVTY